MQETKETSRMDNLKNTKSEFEYLLHRTQNTENRKRRNGIICIISGILFLVLLAFNEIVITSLNLKTDNSIMSFIISDTPYIKYVCFVLGSMLICSGCVDLIFSVKNISKLELKDYISQIDEELELLDIAEKQYEKRAEIQFKNSQKALKRYYDINLAHLKMIFPVGIGTMAIGIAIIILSIVFFKNNAHQNIVPTLIGSLSGILIDFIGAIFIKMYIETVKTSAEFHSKLIHSNDNIFSYSLIMKISDEQLRNTALSELSKIIAKK